MPAKSLQSRVKAHRLTNAQWAELEPYLPFDIDRPRVYELRALCNGIRFKYKERVPWRNLPDCFPPWGTCWFWWSKFKRSEHATTISQLLKQ
jgi:transposase